MSVTTSAPVTAEITTIKQLRRTNEVARPLPIFSILSAILIVQVAVMVTLQNTAFQDESLYLYAGKDILNSWITGQHVTDTYGTYMSGFPDFYPVLAGMLDQIGGLQLARGLSMLSTVWLTVVVFLLGRRLFSDRVGLLGAAFFAIQSNVLFIGRLATYDAFSLALLGTAIAFATSRPRWWKTVLLMVFAAAAPVAKYATAVFVPSALLVCVVLIFQHAGLRAMVRQIIVALVAGAGCAVILVVLLKANPDVLQGLTSTTTNRSVGDASPALTVLTEAARYLALFAALTVAGAVMVVVRKRASLTSWVSILLAASVFIAPAYHVLKGELTSLDKHIAFGMMFGAPLVGYLFSRLVDSRLITHLQGLAVSVAVFLIIFTVNLSLAHGLFTTWPNSSAMLYRLQTLVRHNNTRVLTEEMEVPRYYLTGSGGIASYWQFTGMDYFQYKAPDGSTLSGDAAYASAIANGYFGVVVYDYGPSASTDALIVHDLQANPSYKETNVIPFKTSNGTSYYHVWRLVKPVGS